MCIPWLSDFTNATVKFVVVIIHLPYDNSLPAELFMQNKSNNDMHV